MSVGAGEEEEPDDALLWCETHEFSYRESYGCAGCRNEAADRLHDESLTKEEP